MTRPPPMPPSPSPVPRPRPMPTLPSAAHAKRQPTTLHTDCVGRDVPAYLNDAWESRTALTRLALRLRTVREDIDDGQRLGDKRYTRVTSTTVALIKRCEGELREAMPYALCVFCQGADGGCNACVGGFHSKLQWDAAVPEKMKAAVQTI